jgi:hypothetical protein
VVVVVGASDNGGGTPVKRDDAPVRNAVIREAGVLKVQQRRPGWEGNGECAAGGESENRRVVVVFGW